MRKKSKRILAAALSAILIWNTCEWQPQALAADSLQQIGAETEADDTEETAEKEATLKKSALKASPSNAEAKDNRGESGTNKSEAESGANKAESGADADTGKAEAGADAGADKAEAGANEAPNGTATGAEIKTEIEAFLELDEAIAVQKLPLGAKESDIILPDTLEVEVEGVDEMLAEDSQNVHLMEAANKGTEKDTEAETATWQISGITWKLNEEQSDLLEFHGGISEKDYFEEFDENGEPVETSTKTWAGYAEANQEYNGRVYVYTPILPENLGKFEVADTADLPEIDVMVGDAGVALLADAPYDLNGNYLEIDENNVDQFDGKTITGNYCPTNRPESTYTDIKGGITIDDVTVNLTIKNVTIQSGGNGASGWDLAGIYLKGNARLNLTLEGDNTLLGLDHGAGIEVEKRATLVITENSTGSLRAVGGAYGAAGIGGNAGSTDSEGANYGTGTIRIKGGTISADGGAYWVPQTRDYEGGAGIGTGRYGIGGIIEILGGTITAEGGKQTGAGIGGGMSGRVDTIVIGGTIGKAPDITVSSYKDSTKGYMGAAIGSGWNGVSGLILSCGDIRILSGSVEVTGGNIGYGVLRPLGGNSMKGGSITISEKVQLKLPVGSKIEPRGDCTYGKKTFQIAAYDNQLANGTYQADISLYRENDRERTTPVYQTNAEMTVSGFRGTIPDITQWIGHSGNMQMVVALQPSGSGTVKTMEGRVALNKGTDETISVMLGQNAYQKTMDLTIHDGRLKNDKNYTLTVQIGKEASEGGTAPDVVSYSSKKASGYQLKTDKVSWYTPLSGEVPVSVLVQEEGGEGENTNSFTVTGTLTMKPEEETNLSLTIGEPLYPVRFHFYSSKVQAAENVSLTAGRLAGALEAPVELKQDEGQFAFDGKLTIDAEAGNHAYALAYLPAGNYRFVINTGITELGSSDERFTLDNETVKAAAAGTDIIVLNAAEALEGELDLSLGNISFSEENGKLTILYSKRDASGQAVTAKLIDQSYDKCYRITSSVNNVENYHLSVDTPASRELKLVLKNLTITPTQAIAPIQINGASQVITYLEGENTISINISGKSSSGLNVSPAGISVASGAKLTIDSEPGQPGSIEVLNKKDIRWAGAAIGGDGGQDAGTIHIKGGTVIVTSASFGAAIGASAGKSVEEIRISGGTVTAKSSSNGAGIGTGSANSQKRTGKIVIEGGTVNASSESGAGIGSGHGYAPGDSAITADIEIHGGMITAYSEVGACIGSGKSSSSKVLIDGGTICLDNRDKGYRNVAHIGKGAENSTLPQTDVTITGGTICLIRANGYISRPIIYGWEQVDGNGQQNKPKDANGKPVYFTTADLTGIYEHNTLVEQAGIEGSSYSFQDVRTDASGKLYMYLPASEAVKASFGGVEFTGKVEAGKDENVLEREETSIDYRREVLKNMALYDLEYAESQDATTWKRISKGGEVSLTEILDKQPESATEITLYVRKAATGSTTEGEATEIKIPARPAKPAQIQGTDITKDSYSIRVKGQGDSRYEYGIAESADGELQWQPERTFTSPKPAHTYYITLRVKATDRSFASKPADRLSVTTPDTLLIDGPAGKASFETIGTYGQTLDQILVHLAEGFKVVNYSRSPVSGTWKFSANQSGTPASSIYPEVKGTTAYQVEFIPTKTSEGQYGETLTQSVIPEVSPKELHAVLTTPIEKDYDGRTDIALKATVEIGTPGQSYTISGLKGSFADANAGTGKTVTIDSSEARVETGESTVNLQNYLITYPVQTGTIRPIQGSVSIDPQAWTGEKTYGDDSFSLTGVKKVGDGALKYESSDENVLTVDAQGQVTIKGTGSAEVSITMAEGTNYLGTSTPAKGTITIEKGTLSLTLTAVNRSTGVQQPEGILGTYEDDFDIIARIQGAYGDKLQGRIHFYDNGNQVPDTIPVGEAGTAVLKLPKPGVASVGTHRMTVEFDFDTHQEWAAKYNTPAPAAFTFTIGKVAAPQITWPTAASVKAGSPLRDSALSGGSTEYGSFAWKNPAQTAQAGTHSYEVVFTPNEGASARYEIAAMTGTAEVTATEDKPGETEKPGESDKSNGSNRTDDSDDSDKPEKPNRNSSSSGQNKTSGSGVIRQDSVKGTIDSMAGIITGETSSFANDGKSHWMLDEHGWWLRFADNTYPKGSVRESGGISHSWEHINGNWWAFDETGYAKTGWLRDEDYGGWFYMDLEHGMQTGWVLLNGAWYYFNPVSDGKRGMMYAGQRTPDGYYVEKNGVWDGRNKQ
ncbi:hypothetical protein DWY84_15580 [Clostridium sp. AF27-2AA]|uniref:YDG domain-containing protein n=1 Tax=Clostridium sp. AF27-2AA TaxID=2292206 RepID=UPI000E4D7D3D|nr:YDG domain-containing protein [Clostridium sp. AF27-2AA]RHQ30249.1 hypothetical protein DWY84_15580 [Clostridium sp. AF27-2AA]